MTDISIEESLEIQATYQPARSFADSALEWCSKAKDLPTPFHVGEASFLALLYSALALESLLDEEVVRLVPENQYESYFPRNSSVAQRWRLAATKLVAPGQGCREALRRFEDECKDVGNYGLLVRARNQLVHPLVSVEVFGDAGQHIIAKAKIDKLVKDLRGTSWFPTGIRPAFPLALQCLESARWSVKTLDTMVQLWFETLGEPLPEKWQQLSHRAPEM